MKRLLPVAATLLALAGCGGSDPEPPSSVDENDNRAVALWCLQEQQHLDARLAGEHAIVVGDPETGPRIRFYLTSGETEAVQFQGRAEGSEQIGGALLSVREGSDELLEDVERCLDDL